MLKPRVPVVIIHSMVDEFSNPVMHPDYWNLLLKSQRGFGIDGSNYKLVVVTDPFLSHDAFQPLVERSNKDESSPMATMFNDTWRWLDKNLQRE